MPSPGQSSGKHIIPWREPRRNGFRFFKNLSTDGGLFCYAVGIHSRDSGGGAVNVFDIIGPVMIGPSSSHTAGAVRLGRIALKLLGERAVRAEIGLSGSFAETYRGHGTDKALVAGIMGLHSDDDRIRRSLELAEETGLSVTISETQIPGAHPNTARIALTGASGARMELQGSSVGGGNVLITSINGMAVSFTGQYNTILVRHLDKPGAIAAVTQFMAGSGVNIGNFRLSRERRGGEALMTIEVDGDVSDSLMSALRGLPPVQQAVLIRAM